MSSLKFTLSGNEFLEYHLYLNSTTKTLVRKRLVMRLFLSFSYSLVGVYFYLISVPLAAILFIVFGFIWFFFYPKMSRNTYTRFYKKHIKESYQTKMTNETIFTYEDNFFFFKDSSSESKFNVSEIEKITEIKTLFIVKIKNGSIILLPKNEETIITLNAVFNQIGITVQDDTKWQWK